MFVRLQGMQATVLSTGSIYTLGADLVTWTIDVGNQGAQAGNQGNVGAQGNQGKAGAQGAPWQGPQGNQGTGVQGTQGNQGRQGGASVPGVQGWQGFQGPQGWQGNQGQPGPNTGITDGITFAASVVNPSITQDSVAAPSTPANNMTLAAQAASQAGGSSTNGGSLILGSGKAGASGTYNGAIKLYGGNIGATLGNLLLTIGDGTYWPDDLSRAQFATQVLTEITTSGGVFNLYRDPGFQVTQDILWYSHGSTSTTSFQHTLDLNNANYIGNGEYQLDYEVTAQGDQNGGSHYRFFLYYDSGTIYPQYASYATDASVDAGLFLKITPAPFNVLFTTLGTVITFQITPLVSTGVNWKTKLTIRGCN